MERSGIASTALIFWGNQRHADPTNEKMVTGQANDMHLLIPYTMIVDRLYAVVEPRNNYSVFIEVEMHVVNMFRSAVVITGNTSKTYFASA